MGRSGDGLSLLFKMDGMLHVCTRDKNGFDLSKLSDSFINFVQLKRNEQCRLAYSHADDNHLEVLNENMECLALVDSQGLEAVDPKREHLTAQGTYGKDDHIFLWPAGNGYLGIVDLEALEYDLIEDLGGMGTGEYLAINLQSAADGRKVLVSVFQKASGSSYLKYWQKADPPKPPITVPSEYVDPERSLV